MAENTGRRTAGAAGGGSVIGAAAYRIGFDAKPFLDGMKAIVATLKEAMTQSSAFKASLAAVGVAAALLPKILESVSEGAKALYGHFKLFGGAGAFFDKIGPPVESVKKVILALGGAALLTFRDFGNATTGLGRKLLELVGFNNQLTTAVTGGGGGGGGGVVGAFKSFNDWLGKTGLATGLVVGVIGGAMLPLLASLSRMLSSVLAPDFSHLTTEVVHITGAMEDLQVAQQNFANALQEGQSKATFFTDAILSIKAAFIPTDKAIVSTIGTIGAYASQALAAAGAVLSLAGTVANFTGIILIFQAALKTQAFASFFANMGLTKAAFVGIVPFVVELTRLMKITFMTTIAEVGQALGGMIPRLAQLGASFTALAAKIGMGPLGLALIIGTVLVGAFVGVQKAFANTDKAVEKHMGVLEKLKDREKDLYNSIMRSIQAMKDRTQQMLADQAAAVQNPEAATMASTQEFEEAERQRAQQADDFIAGLEKAGDLTKEQLDLVKETVKTELEVHAALVNNQKELRKQILSREKLVVDQAKETVEIEKQIAQQQQLIDAERTRIELRTTALSTQSGTAADKERKQLNLDMLEVQRKDNALKEERIRLEQKHTAETKERSEEQRIVAQSLVENGDIFAQQIRDADRGIAEATAKLAKLRTETTALIKSGMLGEGTAAYAVEQQKQIVAQETIVQKLTESRDRMKQFVELNQKSVATTNMNVVEIAQLQTRTTELGTEQARILGINEQIAATSKQISQNGEVELANIERRRAAIAATVDLKLQELAATEQGRVLQVKDLDTQIAKLQYENDSQKNGEQIAALTTQRIELDKQGVLAQQQQLQIAIQGKQELLATHQARLGILKTIQDGSDEVTNEERAIAATNAELKTMGATYKAIGGDLGLIAVQMDQHKKDLTAVLALLDLQAEKRAHESEMIKANMAIVIERLTLEQTLLANQLEYLQGEDATLKNQKQGIALQQRMVQIAGQILEKQRDIKKEEIASAQSALEREKLKLSELEKLGKTNKLYTDQVQLIEAAAKGIELMKAGMLGLQGAVDGTNTKMAALNREAEHLSMVSINFGDTMRTAVNEGLESVIFGTRKMADVFEGMKVSVIRTFADMFAQMVQKKLSFDTLWSRNWLEDIPGLVKQGLGTAMGWVGSFFNSVGGMFGGGGGAGGGGFMSAVAGLFNAGSVYFGGGGGGTGGGGGLLSTLGNVGTIGGIGRGLFGGGGGGFGGVLAGGSSTAGGMFGNVVAGGSSTAGGFGGGLGGFASLGGGLAGGLLGNYLSGKFGIGQSKPGQIGGMAGGAGGGILGGMAGGALLGSTLGPIGTVIGAAIGALVGVIGGGAIGDIFKPGRIATEKSSIGDYMKDVWKLPTPNEKVPEYLKRAGNKYDSSRAGLTAIGLDFANDSPEGGIGTLKRTANIGIATFEKAGLSVDEAKEKVLELAQAAGFTLKKAFDDLKDAMEGGFSKDNQLTLKEYNEEVKEGQKNIVTYGDLLAGTFDVLSGFSDKVSGATVANELMAEKFKEVVTAGGDYNEEMRLLGEQVRAGTIPLEEAINKYNELQKAQGEGKLELKDFQVSVKDARLEYLKFGIALDETGEKALGMVDEINQVKDAIKALDQQIQDVNRTIKALDFARLKNAFDIDQAIRRAKGDTSLRESELTARRRREQLIPAFEFETGGISLSNYGRLPDYMPTTGRGGISMAGRDLASKFSLDELQRQGAIIDEMIQSHIQEFDQALQEEAARLSEMQAKQAQALTDAANAAMKAITDQLQAEEKLAQARVKALQDGLRAEEKKAQEFIKAKQKEAEAIRKAANVQLEALQKQLQAAQAFKQLGESLKANIIAITASTAAPISPFQRFGFLEEEAERLRGKMKGTTGVERANLMGELQGILNQMLQAMPFQRPDSSYKKIFDEIVNELAKMRDEATGKGTEVERIQAEILAVQKKAEADLEAINKLIEAEQERIDKLREEVSEKIQAEMDRIDQLREAAQIKLDGIREQLEKDLKTLDETTKKQFEEFKKQRAEELEKQLLELKGAKDANLAAQIEKMKEVKEELERQREELVAHQAKLEADLATLLEIQMPDLLQLLRDIARNTGSPGDENEENNSIAANGPNPLAAALQTTLTQALAGLQHEVAPVGALSSSSIAPLTTTTTNYTFYNENHVVVNTPPGMQVDADALARQLTPLVMAATEQSLKYGRLGQITKAVLTRS